MRAPPCWPITSQSPLHPSTADIIAATASADCSSKNLAGAGAPISCFSRSLSHGWLYSVSQILGDLGVWSPPGLRGLVPGFHEASSGGSADAEKLSYIDESLSESRMTRCGDSAAIISATVPLRLALGLLLVLSTDEEFTRLWLGRWDKSPSLNE